MGEEARTGKRFPLELPIKIHKGDAAGRQGCDRKSERGRCVHPRGCVAWKLVRPWSLKSRCRRK